MKYAVDHDLHIHSRLSACSTDDLQTPQAILDYGKKNNYKYICLTDHYWDEKASEPPCFYNGEDTAHIKQSLPLPQDDKVKFYFGCETEMDKRFNLAISDEMINELDFIIIPTTHLHMTGTTIDEKDDSIACRRKLYIERFARLLEKNLPFEKIGIAHLTCSLMRPKNFPAHIEILDGITDRQFEELFAGAAEKGIGIELNFHYNDYNADNINSILRPYIIAKEQHCKFYLGSDSHTRAGFELFPENFNKIVEALKLEEADKFNPFS